MSADLTDIKNKIQSSSLLSESEKSEWLFLLPKMTDEQKAELTRILEVRMPAQTEKPSTSPGLQPPSPGLERAGRGRTTTESATLPPTTPPRAGGEGESPIPHSTFSISPYGESPVGKQNSELTVEAMRSAPSVFEYFDHLAAQMAVKVKTNQAAAEAVVAEFQQSPLYEAYVAAGRDMLEGREPQALTRSEFEAVAEFRASLKKILASP